MEKLKALWKGDLPLRDAFWNWAVTAGLLVNVVTSLLFLMLITLDQDLLALLLGYGLSVPYNLLVVVGVWRSASRYEGPEAYADLAKGMTVIMMIVLSLT